MGLDSPAAAFAERLPVPLFHFLSFSGSLSWSLVAETAVLSVRAIGLRVFEF
jgi:hypothetical protein